MSVLSKLNECINIDINGDVSRYDLKKTHEVLKKLDSIEIAQEIRRCLDLGTFKDNRLLDLSNYQGASGALTFLYMTPYVKDAHLKNRALFGGFTYREINLPFAFKQAYPSRSARGVALASATKEIEQNPRFIALFSGNIVGQVPTDYDFAFFFVEKFVTRFYDKTNRALTGLWTSSAFPHLRHATRADLAMAVSIWIHLHEYFHSQSPLPISTYTEIKNSFLAGAFEEMRVDMSVIVEEIAPIVGAEMRELVFEYVLVERLVYYASAFEPRDDFDAVTSLAMVQLFEAHEHLSVTSDAQFYFQATAQEIRATLHTLVKRMDRIDDRLSLQADEMRLDPKLQKVLRGHFEDIMSLMSGAYERKALQRGVFHRRHAQHLAA